MLVLIINNYWMRLAEADDTYRDLDYLGYLKNRI